MRELLTNAFNLQLVNKGLFDLANLFTHGRDSFVQFRLCRQVIQGLRIGQHRPVGFHITEDRAGETVVILLQDRIEFVIVAAGTLNSHAQNSASQCFQHIIQIIPAPFRIVFFTEIYPGSGSQESGGNARLMSGVVELISRQLFGNKLVVRFVIVESSNDIIAIAPGVGPVYILFIAIGVGITGYIQPVAAPAFPILR